MRRYTGWSRGYILINRQQKGYLTTTYGAYFRLSFILRKQNKIKEETIKSLVNSRLLEQIRKECIRVENSVPQDGPQLNQEV